MSGSSATPSRASEPRRRAVLIRIGTLAGVALAAMTAVTPALRRELDLPLAALALLGTLLVNLMVFERTRAYPPAASVVLGASAGFFLVVVHYTEAHPASLVWASLFQTLPYFLAGRRIGAAAVLSFNAAFITIVLLNSQTDTGASDRTFLVGLMVSLAVLAGVSFLFEHARSIAHNRLIAEIADRRRAEAEARKASDNAKRAAVAQARFLANMSHEIRTPMNGVLGVNELLLLTSLTDEQKDYARTIDASAKSLLTVLNDILDLSKIDSGHVELERRPFELEELLTSLVALYQPEAQKKNLSIRLEMKEGLPTHVEGDSQRLRQVLANLLRNAVKFTDRGHIELIVQRHANDDRLRFEVRDTGIGLAPAQKERIFGAFQQGDASTTRRYGGTGLGLSISKQLVYLMGGQIGADGRPGRGSVFWCIISLPPVQPGVTAHPRTGSSGIASPLGQTKRVLVVEDTPVNRKVICRMLQRLKLEVDTADDGQYAVDMWQPGRYAMVFMDVQMPRLDGLDATHAIRRMEDRSRRVPIVALTANAMLGDRERCLAAGMDDYLSKPVAFKELKRVVIEWMGTASSPPEDQAESSETSTEDASEVTANSPASTTAS